MHTDRFFMVCGQNVGTALELINKCLQQNPDDQPVKIYKERCEAFFKYGFQERAKELDYELKWSNKFKVGVKEIDEQHQELLANSIELSQSIETGVSKAKTDRILEYLDHYVANHFKTEEKCMAEINYPFIEAQKTQHRNFTRSLKRLKDEIGLGSSSKTYILFRIQIMVIDWIINHTLKEDMHFKRYFK